MVQLSHPYMTTGKTIVLTIWIFVDKVMSLLFNMLSRLVTTFLPRSKRFLISWLQSPSSDLGAQEDKICQCFHFYSYLSWSDRTGSHDLSFLNVEFRAAFSALSPSVTLIKRLFSSSSLSAIKVVSSAYLRLLIFLTAILILACDSSSLAFHMMHSACKLNRKARWWYTVKLLSQFWTSQLFISSSNCCFLTSIQVS